MSASFYDLQKFAATCIASPEMTHYDKMRALSMAGGKIKALTGVPPLTFKSNGKPLISLSMLGNGQQTGTPTPDNPVMPEFVGVRTANLLDVKSKTIAMSTAIVVNSDCSITDVNIASGSADRIIWDKVFGYGTYTFKADINGGITKLRIYSSVEFEGGTYNTYYGGWWADLPQNGISFTVNADFNFGIIFSGSGRGMASNIMLNSGSTALPYEPFGYKIPLTCAEQTTPIYTTEQETTRQIRKIAFDGTETGWQLFLVSGVHQFYIDNALASAAAVSGSSAVSNIAPYGATAANRASYQYGCYAVSSGNGIAFQMVGSASDFPDVAAWKAYLAAQYAAGTPVTAWYVLAEPETGIINEPLARIGDYADELSSTDAGVSIPTIKGSNTLTVDTDLQPSEMTITYTK